MKKEKAIEIWGTEVVELARDYYETNYDKVLFAEDCSDDEQYPASIEDVVERCSRANVNFHNLTTELVVIETFRNKERIGYQLLAENAVNIYVEAIHNIEPEWQVNSYLKQTTVNGVDIIVRPEINYEVEDFIADVETVIPGMRLILLDLAIAGMTVEHMQKEILSKF